MITPSRNLPCSAGPSTLPVVPLLAGAAAPAAGPALLPATPVVAEAPLLPPAAVLPAAEAPLQPQLLAPLPAAGLPAPASPPSVAVPPTAAEGSVSALSIASSPAPGCTDVPPGPDFTCQQQVGMPAAGLTVAGQAAGLPVASSLTMPVRRAACCRPLTWPGQPPAVQHSSFSALPLLAMHVAAVMFSACVLKTPAAIADCTSCSHTVFDENAWPEVRCHLHRLSLGSAQQTSCLGRWHQREATARPLVDVARACQPHQSSSFLRPAPAPAQTYHPAQTSPASSRCATSTADCGQPATGDLPADVLCQQAKLCIVQLAALSGC